MKPGEHVQHPVLGHGTIRAVYAKGGHLGAEVDFGYMSEWIPATELGVGDLETGDDSKTETPELGGGSPPQSPLPGEVVDARRGVLALKLGQVLEEHVLKLSTGIEKEKTDLESAVLSALQRQARSILVEGVWGSGKTHLLTVLSAIATTHGMATSSVILDGDAVTLSEPMGLMEAFLSSLRYPGEHTPRGLNQRLAGLRRSGARGRSHHPGSGRIANAIFDVPTRAFDEPEVIEVLEDYFTLSVSATQANARLANLGWRSVKLPPMKARSVDDRPARFCELLHEWAEFVALTGAKGLVLIFDEVDVDYASTIWTPELRRRRTNLLRMLGNLLKSSIPLVVAFGGAPGNAEIADEHDPVRDLKKQLEGFSVELEAPRPTLEQLRQLAKRIQELYAIAFHERMTGLDQEKLAKLIDDFVGRHMKTINPVPRHFVRGTLERLDVLSTLPSHMSGS